ncbi:central glycolytic genes regulator [Gracilibacillus boraciitolerans JCM 21714]|uniref:Central glycolytic genes regulator n=1 Tax=Gracilibacillus boraciitolerans JCM 21714 TaxID=1298598 RepID=W4VHY7_9BACI|nr:sugar-binding domain-containing protein [Gracilibacillus boraciitolerans]GAE92781.1 central glycolytic genes regulator [Gracilibacillus boraciitolerans JCM 21714]
MKELLDIQEKLFPDLLDVMQKRYKILHYIQMMQPIGRRSLADNIKLKERVVRSEIDFLSKNGFIMVTAKGMQLTTDGGEQIIERLSAFMNEISEFRVLESQIKDKLQLERVIIISGNSDEHLSVKKDLGKACIQYLTSILISNQTIAVTGGTTMAEVASQMKPSEHAVNCTFVPARGGLGEQVENQANTICAQMAKRANGNYRMLYVPDPLSEDTYDTIIEEPAIKDILDIIHDANIVLHSIGDAVTMAKRRKASDAVLGKLINGNAVSEAFGYYLDEQGNVVHKVKTVGLQLEELERARYIIAVAGGTSKAKAIQSYFRQGKSNVLITDEAAAKELLKG